MIINNNKELEEIFTDLPDAMASRLVSSDMVIKVMRIGEMHGLASDQIETLQTIMALAFWGKLSFDAVEQEIEDDIIATEEQLAGIKKDIETQIIIPFIDELKDEQREEESVSTGAELEKNASAINKNMEIKKVLRQVSNSSLIAGNEPGAFSEDAMMPLVVPQNTSAQPQPAAIPASSAHEAVKVAPATITFSPQPIAPKAPVPLAPPAAPAAPASTIMDSRLAGGASLPKENMVIKDAPSQNPQPQTAQQPLQRKTYDGTDPYREPLG